MADTVAYFIIIIFRFQARREMIVRFASKGGASAEQKGNFIMSVTIES